MGNPPLYGSIQREASTTPGRAFNMFSYIRGCELITWIWGGETNIGEASRVVA
jgi:hypothetical protein